MRKTAYLISMLSLPLLGSEPPKADNKPKVISIQEQIRNERNAENNEKWALWGAVALTVPLAYLIHPELGKKVSSMLADNVPSLFNAQNPVPHIPFINK